MAGGYNPSFLGRTEGANVVSPLCVRFIGLSQSGGDADDVEKKVVEVRNTFGPNMSFKREVFEKVGLFNEKLGFAKRGNHVSF